MLKDDEIGEPNSRRADPINIISDPNVSFFFLNMNLEL
jgi:hypothetical protein